MKSVRLLMSALFVTLLSTTCLSALAGSDHQLVWGDVSMGEKMIPEDGPWTPEDAKKFVANICEKGKCRTADIAPCVEAGSGVFVREVYPCLIALEFLLKEDGKNPVLQRIDYTAQGFTAHIELH